ncbi:MAG: DNA-directed RNA polymerase subunit alpha [Erysipelotrichaceae bacterium]|nr:DNA-directed RNA polymerase subunit alpha [Erysipelotrichaceae bacterium]MCB9499751.1 DNA-directed RNA polymerase subunit alpha [Erysipelotrichaceae bacterium]
MADNELKIAHPFEKPDFKIAVSLEDEHYCKVVCEPLERGFGLTLGNAMRRTLLTSLTGTSVYAVEVEGAVHEFSALTGIEEDLTQIILNLKDLVLKSDTIGEAEYETTVDVDGPKELTAGDLMTPTGVEVINKDLVIAHVAEGGHLHMVIHMKNGRGYATSEENKLYSLPHGAIATDSNYSPIVRVNYKVDATRVGHDPRFDKLTLEVWTNGSIKPSDAIALASKMLIEHLNNFLNLEEKFANIDLEKDPVAPKEETFDNLSIEDLDLSVRSYNCLKRAGIANVLELTQKSELEMMKVRNLGKKSLKEVKDKLEGKGLHFKDDKND